MFPFVVAKTSSQQWMEIDDMELQKCKELMIRMPTLTKIITFRSVLIWSLHWGCCCSLMKLLNGLMFLLVCVCVCVYALTLVCEGVWACAGVCVCVDMCECVCRLSVLVGKQNPSVAIAICHYLLNEAFLESAFVNLLVRVSA